MATNVYIINSIVAGFGQILGT